MSDELTPEEIADIEEAEKEIKSGKCKTFNTVEEFLADLHKERNCVREKLIEKEGT